MSLLLRLTSDSSLGRKYVHAGKEFKFIAETIPNPVLRTMEGVDDITFSQFEGYWRKYNSLEMEVSRRGYRTISPKEMKEYCDHCTKSVLLTKRSLDEIAVPHSVLMLEFPEVKASVAWYLGNSPDIEKDKAIFSPVFRG
jgi:hypothetical protein